MGKLAKFVVWLFEKLAREGPKRIDAARLARSRGLPANRVFSIQFLDAPNRAIYFRFENDKPVFDKRPQRYDVLLRTKVPTILQIIDGRFSFDEAYAYGELEVIPMDPKSFTGFDLEMGRRLLKECEHLIREIATG